MKMAELINQLKTAEKDTGNFYAGHMVSLYYDTLDAMEEGYIDVKEVKMNRDVIDFTCDNGNVKVFALDGKLFYSKITNKPKRTYRHPMPGMSTYDRTRAMVYATGNKWAIENFNATH